MSSELFSKQNSLQVPIQRRFSAVPNKIIEVEQEDSEDSDEEEQNI